MQSNLIVGTLGHIDHGKTSIIAALNGFWGDSTKEEKERGITLDLSFSNLKIATRNIAFIDMPGHEKLIKNMIAGAFSIDYAMLVVAANEGVMPQTLEHLRIAFLLGISDFLVVLSKCDLVDSSILAKREQEIKALFAQFKNLKYRIFNASIYDKTSIEKLKDTLLELPKKIHKDLGFFRYYIDRVFSIKGSGCVVSGTLIDGDLQSGEKVWCAREQCYFGIKNLQNHGANVNLAKNGERIAINLSGVTHHRLKRGDLLTKKGYLRGFDRIEVEIYAFDEILHNSALELYLGALHCSVQILFLDTQKKYATLKSKIPLFSIFGEKFILRNGTQTLGGGRVLSPIVDPMKKVQKLEYLQALSKGDIKGAFITLLKAHKKGFGLISAMQRFRISQNEALEIAKELEATKDCFVCVKDLVVYPKSAYFLVQEQVFNILHKNPNALLSAALLAQKQSFIAQDFAQYVLEMLLDKKVLKKAESFFVSAENAMDLSNKDCIENYLYTTIYNTLHMQKYEPIAPYNLYDELDIDRKSGDTIFKRLTREKKIVRLSHKLFICTDVLTDLLKFMREIIKKDGYLDINNFKAHLHLSRKYCITYLDYLDNFSDIYNENGKRYIRG